MGKMIRIDFSEKVHDICLNANQYHDLFYKEEHFYGPSLHFHRRALGLDGKNIQTECKSELIYAMLTSWGMHRMGLKGPKMVDFKRFSNSINNLHIESSSVSELSYKDLIDADSEKWEEVHGIFNQLDVMESSISLVSHSKVLAHLFPHLIAPIDREYTLKYLYGKTNICGNKEYQWQLLKKIHVEFFYPICKCLKVKKLIEKWMSMDCYSSSWDTSLLKTIDNLVIGASSWLKHKKIPSS